MDSRLIDDLLAAASDGVEKLHGHLARGTPNHLPDAQFAERTGNPNEQTGFSMAMGHGPSPPAPGMVHRGRRCHNRRRKLNTFALSAYCNCPLQHGICLVSMEK